MEGSAPEGEPNLMPAKPDFSQAAVKEPAPKVGGEVDVEGDLTLKQPITLAAIRPKNVNGSVKAIALRPDGSIEPLIWLYNYKQDYDRTFFLLKPLSFPAGTKIEVSPPSAGALALLAAKK